MPCMCSGFADSSVYSDSRKRSTHIQPHGLATKPTLREKRPASGIFGVCGVLGRNGSSPPGTCLAWRDFAFGEAEVGTDVRASKELKSAVAEVLVRRRSKGIIGRDSFG
jgi:hypothetical protein